MRTESRQMPDYVHYVISGTDNAFEQTIHCYSITAKKCFAQQNAASHLVVNSSWSMGYGRLCLDISAFALGYVTKVSRCVCLRFGCADNRWSLVKQRPEKTECIRRMSGLSANNPSCWLSLRQPLYLSSIATVMGITGGMFAAMALICSCSNRVIPPVRQLYSYIFCGLSIAFVVNLILTSSFSVWLASILTVFIWGITAACEATTLEDLIRVADTSEISGSLRCIVPGAITLYFSILSVLFRITVTVLEFINGLVW